MKKRKIDMVNGPLPVNMIRFVIPIVLTGVLQLMFNACDLVVVGQFAGDRALAAVGATGALINLLVGMVTGLSVGANVLAAQFYGAKDHENIDKIVHTSVLLSFICGVILSVVGVFLSRPCLVAMNTPTDVLDLAVLYMRIYFLGIPAAMVFNFGSALLRAQGNSRHPLLFLTIAGVINVILNLILVIAFDRSVDGVAAATAVSQYVAAALIILFLKDPSKQGCLTWRRLRLDGVLLKKIFRIGIPAGINGMVFSFANMQIQASVNTFGSAAMAGCLAAANIEGFIYTAMNSFSQSSLNFTGQNIGAGKKNRIPKILGIHLLFVSIVGLTLGMLMYFFRRPLLSLYITDPASMEAAFSRMQIISVSYFLCGFLEVIMGVIRGMGYAIAPMIISMLGACGLRLVWIATIFKASPSLTVLYMSFPVSWVVTILAYFVCYLIAIRRLNRKRETNSVNPEPKIT